MPPTRRRTALALVCFSAVSLYLELAVIRFTGAEVLYLGYFSNFVLISAFVGLGLGFLASRRERRLGRFVPFALLFLFALCLVAKFDANLLRDKFGLFFFGNVEGRSGLPGSVLLFTLFLVNVAVFAGLGDLIGRLFPRFPPLLAYTLDIAGSLVGIVLFSLQSAASSGPVVWITTGGLLLALAYLLENEDGALGSAASAAIGAAAIVVLLLSARAGLTIWSPYQKLDCRPGEGAQAHYVYANGILHQIMHVAEAADGSYYGAPFRWREQMGGRLEDVLIIGAGSGTDLAVALRHGAGHVDAVEIDPGIVELGRRLHPDRPFADPRVRVVVDDGRAFLQHTERRYDLILFALTDSLVRLSSMSSVRLESYLFTIESFESARRHLKDDGILVIYNQYRWPWLTDKIALMLEQAFERPPVQVDDGPTTLFAVGPTVRGAARPREAFRRLATDDWPFLYMRDPGVHWLYLGMIAMFAVVTLAGVLVLAPPGTLRQPDGPFFFMGAAFLLLETKSISLFSLLFGTTWAANSYAFAGVLASVLVANLLMQRWPVRGRAILFALLAAALATAYVVPSAALLAVESAALRYAVAVLLVFSPIFCANLVFSREFRDTEMSTRAFAWNLFGAVAGGGLEYLSLLTGQRGLIVIVGACYALAALGLYRRTRRGQVAQGGSPTSSRTGD